MEEWKSFHDYSVSSFGNIKKNERLLKPTIFKKDDKLDSLIITLKINDKQKCFRVHRLIASLFIPNPDNKPIIDHIDNNPLNNNVSNLRWASVSQNNCNRGCKNKLGMKGVSFDKKRNLYQVQVKFEGQRYWLGRFKTAEEAFEAYKEKAKELHLEFVKY